MRVLFHRFYPAGGFSSRRSERSRRFMNPNQRSNIFFKIAFITAAGFLSLAVLAWAFFRPPSLMYAWGNSEYLSVLFARGYFSDITSELMSSVVVPLQQVNLPVACAVIVADSFSIPLPLVAWASLGILGGIILFRAQRLIAGNEMTIENLIFFGLLAIHPFFWTTLSTAPGNLLLLWLVMETWLSSHRGGGMYISGWLAIFSLSLCGAAGFVWALFLALAIPSVKTFSSETKPVSPFREFGFFLSAITPMGFVYLTLTLQFGQIGGMRLPDFPSIFSEIHFSELLSGEWTLHAREWLVWFANGFLVWPQTIPLFGFLVLLGVVDAWTKPGNAQRNSREFAVLFAISFIFNAFCPAETARDNSAPLLPLAIFWAMQGARRLGESLPLQPQFLFLFLCGLLAAIETISIPSEWTLKSKQARYYHDLCEKVVPEVNRLTARKEESAALRFDPVVYCRLNSPDLVYPIGLSFEAPFQTTTGWKSGVYFDARFAPAPAVAVLFPRYNELRSTSQSKERLIRGYLTDSVRKELETFYQSTQVYNLTFYRRNARPQEIIKSWLASAYADGYDFETRALPAWCAKRLQPSASEYYSLSDERLPKPVGLGWSFEDGYANTRQTGFAFGSSPSSEYSAAGARGAGSGNSETAIRLGVLESKPFTIEGDELSFYAKIPQDSTREFFCLAVYDETEYGDAAPTKNAQHIFDRRVGELLMADTFFYIHTEHLSYWPGRIRGWRVVRTLQQSETSEWEYHRWSLDPWKNQQAIWMAADRDPRSTIQIDQITQWTRTPSEYYGVFYNFETGDYGNWKTEGNAFGEKPAIGPVGNQKTIKGFEGNYFINSYCQGSDSATGLLLSPPITLKWDRMEFLVGGGDDLNRLYVGLRVDGELVLRATGDRRESLHPIRWDLTPWLEKTVQIEIADRSSNPWGHILVDDIRIQSSGELVNIKKK